jgi:hypothetical protein
MQPGHYKLCLYIVGNTQKSDDTIDNLKGHSQEHSNGFYEIKVIDML